MIRRASLSTSSTLSAVTSLSMASWRRISRARRGDRTGGGEVQGRHNRKLKTTEGIGGGDEGGRLGSLGVSSLLFLVYHFSLLGIDSIESFSIR